MTMTPRPLLVAGKWEQTGSRMPVHFPYNNELVAEVSLATEETLERALDACTAGFEITRKLPTHKRAEILERLAGVMEERRGEIAETLLLEGGKTRGIAEAEVGRAMETVRLSAEEAKRIHGEILDIGSVSDGDGRMGLVRRFPIGPVLAIAPFNYPLNLACHKVGPAIAAGNPVILKPASSTPLSGLLLGEMILDAGFPPEAISVLPCPGAVAEKMVHDPRIAYITFTGSSQVGWHLKSVCGHKNIGLELGGNAAVILHEDADLDFAAGRIAVGGFTNAGQNCISVQRVLVHEPVFETAMAKIIAAVKALKAGDPRDRDVAVGPMIDGASAVRAMAKVDEALDSGAKTACGAERKGTLFSPTVLTDTTPAMRVRKEEIFAPVISVVPYDTFTNAVAIANETEFGLQHGIFTRDMERILYACEEIQSGGVMINDVSTFRVDHMPYGGIKGSGIGKEGPRYAIEEMTVPKLMVINRLS